jgi:hypothetical protein
MYLFELSQRCRRPALFRHSITAEGHHTLTPRDPTRCRLHPSFPMKTKCFPLLSWGTEKTHILSWLWVDSVDFAKIFPIGISEHRTRLHSGFNLLSYTQEHDMANRQTPQFRHPNIHPSFLTMSMFWRWSANLIWLRNPQFWPIPLHICSSNM